MNKYGPVGVNMRSNPKQTVVAIACFIISMFGTTWAYSSTRTPSQSDLDEFRETYGTDDPRLAPLLINLSEQLKRRGDLEGAETHLQEAIAVLQEGDPVVQAVARNNLANIHVRRGDYETARELMNQAYSAIAARFGLSHPVILMVLNNRALLRWRMGDIESALMLQRSAIKSAEKIMPLNDPALQVFDRNLDQLKRLQEGAPRADRAISTSTKTESADTPPIAKDTETKSPSSPSLTATIVDDRLTWEASGQLEDIVELHRETPDNEATEPLLLSADEGSDQPTSQRMIAEDSDTYALHLGSVRTQRGIDLEWQRLSDRFPTIDQLQRLPAQRVDVEGKGQFLRLLAGRFASRQIADLACAPVLQSGEYCSPVEHN